MTTAWRWLRGSGRRCLILFLSAGCCRAEHKGARRQDSNYQGCCKEKSKHLIHPSIDRVKNDNLNKPTANDGR